MKRTEEEAPRPEANGEREGRPVKRLRGVEPDLTIRIGGQEFKYYSQVLRYASEYIDTMLSSSMKESNTYVIEFPDQNPEEWKMFYPFLEPLSMYTAQERKISKENVSVLVPWFHKFGFTALLQESDAVLVDILQHPTSRPRTVVENLRLEGFSMLGTHSGSEDVRGAEAGLSFSRMNRRHGTSVLKRVLEFASLYDLARSKEECLAQLERRLDLELNGVSVGSRAGLEPTIARLNSIMDLLENEEYRESLWSPIRNLLPPSLKEDDPKALIENRLFTTMIAALSTKRS